MPRASAMPSENAQAALALLKLTSETSDFPPPLRSAAASTLYIVEKVKKFKSNKKEWSDFAQHIRDSITSIIQTVPDTTNPHPDMKKRIEKLQLTLDAIKHNIDDIRSHNMTRRLRNFLKDPEKISEMRKQFDQALDLMNLGPNQMPRTSYTTVGAGQVHNVHGNQSIVYEASPAQVVTLQYIDKIVPDVSPNPALDKLPYVGGASWNPMYMCLPGTRANLFEIVCRWVYGADRPGLFLVKGVAGCGKSAFAHTVAQRFDTAELLATSFFFNRDVSDRNTPQKIFSTIARDLASQSPAFAADIATVLEKHPSLASASLSRQFENFIRGPLARHPPNRPIVIIIDAMDEASEDEFYIELLAILRDDVPKLPQAIRVVITSRPTSILDQFLEGQEHVVSWTIDIHSPENQYDIDIYIRSQLQEIALSTEMSEGWPDCVLFDDFRRAAEGLFIWVSTICNYLRTTYDPDGELRLLISKRSPQGLPPDEKMDKLYIVILDNCNWRDTAFVADYHLVMGVVMAAKRPLSVAAWQALLGDSLKRPVKRLVGSLGSLLTMGATDPSQPLRILHQSLRDFITHRARGRDDTMQFYVSEKEHSRRMALLCLRVINQELLDTVPGTGYLNADEDEIPGIPEVSGVSEQLWYSCESWTAHLADVASPVADEMIDEIRKAVTTRLTLWLELVTVKGQFQGSLGVRTWLQRMVPEVFELYDNEDQGSALFTLSSRLSYNDRREEALTAIEESVELRRTLAAGRPANFTADLAMSLNNFSVRLSDLGRREDALRAIEEAVNLRRKLAAEQPAKFNPDLAVSLNNLSTHLSDLGRREDMLTASEEAVELHRKLAAERPATFNPDLATSLNNLSVYLSNLGRRGDALTAIEDAVELRRKLAAERPATFNSDLADSLNNLSCDFSNLGRQEEALMAIQEAVELRRTLATQRPAKFSPRLADSLNNLSIDLSSLDRGEEALTAVTEAVELRRKLAAERPVLFNAVLADSLNTLSSCLSNLGRRDEALLAKQEALELAQ